jgi:energy-coupling factor transporter ATP-binding protein EcfA2
MAPPLLQLQDIRLTFGGTPLLEGAEFAVSAGERLCLVGRNGSGKSTLLKIAAGLVKASNAGGDLFGDNLILRVEAGAQFDFNNNAESMGGFAGDGTIILGTAGLTANSGLSQTFGGVFTGSGAVTLNSTATYTFTANINRSVAYTGNFTASGASKVIVTDGSAFTGVPVIISRGDLSFSPSLGTITVGSLSGFNLGGALNIGSASLVINNTSGTNRSWNSDVTGTSTPSLIASIPCSCATRASRRLWARRRARRLAVTLFAINPREIVAPLI